MEYPLGNVPKRKRLCYKNRKRLISVFLLLVLTASIFLYIKPQKAAAAVARTGSVTNVQNGNNTGTQSVTIPSDAQIAVVTAEGFNTDTAYLSSFQALTLGGSAMTLQRSDVDTPDGNQTGIWTLINPTTGTQTLSWDWKGTTTFGDGGQINVAFYKGVNTTTPVGSTGGQGINGAANSAIASSGALTIATGDAIVATAYLWDNGGNAGIAGHSSWTNLTAVNGPALFNNSVGSFAEAFPSAGSVTTSSNEISSGNTCYTTQSSIVLKSAATNSTPAAPTLISPASGASGVPVYPIFQLRTTDADNDYLRYKVILCQDSSCNIVISTFNQVSSQIGWSGQDQQTGTAYTGNSTLSSSTIASYTTQSSLALNTTYYWRAFAIDPVGTNIFSSASSIQSFTTTTTGSNVQINGGTIIQGGAVIQ